MYSTSTHTYTFVHAIMLLISGAATCHSQVFEAEVQLLRGLEEQLPGQRGLAAH